MTELSTLRQEAWSSRLDVNQALTRDSLWNGGKTSWELLGKLILFGYRQFSKKEFHCKLSEGFHCEQPTLTANANRWCVGLVEDIWARLWHCVHQGDK